MTRRTRGQRVLTQVEIEDQIQALAKEYEEAVDHYEAIGRESANAEADWKFAFHRNILTVTDERPRSNAEWREAKASIQAGENLYRASKVTEASKNAAKEHLTSLRTRLDALRTLAANQRALVTG